MITVSGRVRLLASGVRRWLLFVAAGFACAGLATLSPWVWSRSLGAIPLFLLLPGWTIVVAISTGRPSRIGIVAIPALSVATTILCGLVLTLARYYHPTTIVVAVLLVIVAVAMTLTREERFDTSARLSRPRILGMALPVATTVVLLTIVVAAISASVTSANRDSAAARTIGVWAIRDNKGLSVGVVDGGGTKGPDVAISSGSERLARWVHIPLRDGRWTAHLSLAAGKCGAVTVTVSSRGHVERALDVSEGCTHE